MSDAVEKAAEAAQAVVEAKTAVETELNDQAEIARAEIENAQERVENAEAMAQSIADAAVMTETGKRLEAHIAEDETWRARVSSLETELTGVKSTLADLSAKLPPNLIMPLQEPPRNNLPIRPQSEKTEVVMADNPLDADVADQKEAERNKKRKRVAL